MLSRELVLSLYIYDMYICVELYSEKDLKYKYPLWKIIFRDGLSFLSWLSFNIYISCLCKIVQTFLHSTTAKICSFWSPRLSPQHFIIIFIIIIFSFLFVVAMKRCPIAAKIAGSTGILFMLCFKQLCLCKCLPDNCVRPFLVTILCVREIWSCFNNSIIYMYHVFHVFFLFVLFTIVDLTHSTFDSHFIPLQSSLSGSLYKQLPLYMQYLLSLCARDQTIFPSSLDLVTCICIDENKNSSTCDKGLLKYM